MLDHEKRTVARVAVLQETLHGAQIASMGKERSASLPRRTPAHALTDPKIIMLFMAIDALVIFAASLASWFMYHEFSGAQLSNWKFYALTSMIFAAIFVANGLRSSIYGFLWGVERQDAMVKIFRGFTQSFLFFVTVLVMLHWADVYSRVTLLVQFLVCGVAVLALRSAQFGAMQKYSVRSRLVSNRVILVGSAVEIKNTIRVWRQRHENVQVLKSISVGQDIQTSPDSAPYLQELADKVISASRSLRPDRVVILLPLEARSTIDLLVERFAELPVSILVSTESITASQGTPSVLTFGGLRMLRIVRKPLSATDRITKRAMDFLLSLIVLVLLAPVLLIAAIAIKLDSAGPVFFLQNRKGFNQKEFRIFKFRTMRVASADAAFRQTEKNDQRVTRVGRILRRYNIDELPQLINVLKGEMSLVGPRPHAVEHDEMYYSQIAVYARRHNMKPGITGLAQSLGFRGATDTLQQMEDRVARDIQYIQNWSLLLDLKILLMTAFSPRAYLNAY